MFTEVRESQIINDTLALVFHITNMHSYGYMMCKVIHVVFAQIKIYTKQNVKSNPDLNCTEL